MKSAYLPSPTHPKKGNGGESFDCAKYLYFPDISIVPFWGWVFRHEMAETMTKYTTLLEKSQR